MARILISRTQPDRASHATYLALQQQDPHKKIFGFRLAEARLL